MDSPAIPDELLADIFLRLPAPADLVRTSAACVSFRRLVSSRSFLRRFRELYAPPLLGFLDEHGFHPAIPPHPAAPAASAAALAADFSFAFLPSPASHWSVRDVRDGRVLLDRPRRHETGERRGHLSREIVVCDPLYRQYRLLPPIPDDLAASVEDSLGRGETFLAPPDHDEEATDETSFRVIWMGQCITKIVAFVFCSGTGEWRATPSVSWNDLFPGFAQPTWMSPFSWRQHAYGCFYWMAGWSEKFLVLDSRRMEFSVADRPPVLGGLCSSATMAIVEAGGGMTGMFVPAQYTFSHSAHDTHSVTYTIRRNNGGSSSHWQMEKTIPMGSGCLFIGSLGSHLLLYMHESLSLEPGCFTLDVRTFKLERVCSLAFIPKSHAYCNFPPSILSSPTVSSGKLSFAC
uniref:Uncharacterized protein n=1 Tax=Avena sativa TaxID=4498 RepID=A0ACD5Y3T8_AVESA